MHSVRTPVHRCCRQEYETACCDSKQHLCRAPAGHGKLLDVFHGGVQVRLVLGAPLPPLILRLQVLACSRLGTCISREEGLEHSPCDTVLDSHV